VPNVRHLHGRRARRHHQARRRLRARGGLIALAAVVGPGVLAGLSDDDPAGIATYSILGADHGYELLWVLTVSTAALILFHELGARMGVVTGRGLAALVRERHGARWAHALLVPLVAANVGTVCAEFAGVAAALSFAGVAPAISVPIAAVAVTVLVLGSSFHRVEHVLLGLSSTFAAYLIAGVLAHPDWGAAARGLVVPTFPGDRAGVLAVVAGIGTTLAPWGLAFIGSYAADKRVPEEELRYERVDVLVGALLTGVIGVFIVVACAATLHAQGRHIVDAGDAAAALEPLAGHLASALFAAGLLGAALLAASVVPLSTAYSVSEAVGHEGRLDDHWRDARVFYATYVAVAAVGAALVLIPGAPLMRILYLTQALNAVLLIPVLWVMRRIAADRGLMGRHALTGAGRVLTGAVLVALTLCVAALGWLSL
jgi:NRAMP (natural resistance-associated macrophage protein)-like metal ion transporter